MVTSVGITNYGTIMVGYRGYGFGGPTTEYEEL